MSILPERVSRLVRRIGKPLVYYAKHPTRLFESERVVTSEDGIRFWCREENLIERSIASAGVWEREETLAFRAQIRPGNVVIDVGANVGYFSLLASKLTGNAGQVHSFEPTRYGAERLARNIALNRGHVPVENIVVNKLALSTAKGVQQLALEARFSERILASSEPEVLHFDTLTDYCRERSLPRIDFLKIDVDGHDLNVVRGGAEIIRQMRPIILAEFCQRVLKDNGTDVHELGRAFSDLGYERCALYTGGTAKESTLTRFLQDECAVDGTWSVLLYRD